MYMSRRTSIMKERTRASMFQVRGGHDAAAEWAIEGSGESMLAAGLLQIGAFVEGRMKWIKPDANFWASNALIEFVRERRRREAVYVDDQAVVKLTESARDGLLQHCMVWFAIRRHQFSALGMAENSQWLPCRQLRVNSAHSSRSHGLVGVVARAKRR
jgi:hypothetical protein